MRKIIIGAAMALAGVVAASGQAGANEPMCVEFFEENFNSTLANHGQHILGDYIMGTGHDGAWPPAGEVGEVVGGNGPVAPGASGIMQHGAPPGASFCNESNSPSAPPGRD